MTASLLAAGAARRALRRRSALLAVPLLLDRGPVDRLGGARGRRHRRRAALAAGGGWSSGSPRGSARGSRPASGSRGREAIARRLDLAGRPAGMTVQRFIGLKGALALLAAASSASWRCSAARG